MVKVTQQPTRRATGWVTVTLLAGALMTPVLIPATATAGEQRKRPRVEDVAVDAVEDLGDDAPAAVLAALDDGVSLKKVERRIGAGTLAAPVTSDASGADSRLTVDDYRNLIDALTQATDQLVAAGEFLPAEDARELRKDAKQEQASVVDRNQTVTADPNRILMRAEDQGVDPGAALFVNAILLAANNGYDVGQITGFILDDLLDPKVADTDEGLLRLRGPFIYGGAIVGVAPNGAPVDVFKVTPRAEEPAENDQDDSQDDGGNVKGNYHGRFTGTLLTTLVESSFPGATSPTRNGIGVTIDKNGVMRFVLELVVRAAWVSEDDTVTCASVYDYFATLTPRRPRAELHDDGTFESRPFTASTEQSDFSGPTCATHPYTGENDQDVPNVVLTGSVKGDAVRGELQFQGEDGGAYSLEFQAKAFRM